MTLRRTQLGYLANLIAPTAITPEGALCLTCGRVVDYEELVEGYPGESTFARVLVRHHGAEELRTFPFDSKEWDSDDLKRAMRAAKWFDPAEHGTGDAFLSMTVDKAAS